MTITDYIQQEIEKSQGFISFAQFMQAALYHPSLGYYTSPEFELGKEGDFTTAPEISPLFAQCLAHQCDTLLAHIPQGAILELGAGSGRMAKDLQQALKIQPNHYYIYEISPALRKKQQQLIAEQAPELLANMTWLTALPRDFDGIIIGNEVLDALPVTCFMIDEQGIKERGVTWQQEQFAWQTQAASENLLHALEQIPVLATLAPGYLSEINLSLPEFIKNICHSLRSGVILLADYGYGQQEYYHPERNKGTLSCFYQHQKNDNPLIHIGQQDITAHVDFTLLIEQAASFGCDLLGFSTQAGFLLANGLMDLVDSSQLSPKEEFALNQAIKKLSFPSEMGEVVKVMGLSKNISLPADVWQAYDRSRDL